LFRPEPLFNPLARRGRKVLIGGFYQLVRVIVRSLPQKSQLLSVTATPFAKKQVDTKAKTLN
jgi:hypothetical protein